MEQDTRLLFGKMHEDSAGLMEHMLKIQECMSPGDRSDEWARNLRLLCVPGVPVDGIVPINLDTTPNNLRLTHQGERPNEVNYISVSYCWPKATEKLIYKSGGYIVQTAKGVRSSRAPDRTLLSANKYAAAHRIPFIWIDQECIEQDQLDDKELGINSMDMVYRRGLRTLGILGSVIMCILAKTDGSKELGFTENDQFQGIVFAYCCGIKKGYANLQTSA